MKLCFSTSFPSLIIKEKKRNNSQKKLVKRKQKYYSGDNSEKDTGGLNPKLRITTVKDTGGLNPKLFYQKNTGGLNPKLRITVPRSFIFMPSPSASNSLNTSSSGVKFSEDRIDIF